MSLETVTGILEDFGWTAFASLQPTLTFSPSSAAVNLTSHIFFSRPIEVTPASDGSFSVSLESTDKLFPADFHYRISIRWLNGDGVPLGFDYPDFKMYVPPGGGSIGDMISAPASPVIFWVGETPPLGPTKNTQWLTPSTGDIKGWT